jgi:hypothetical protein
VQFTIEDPVIPGEPLSDSLIVVGDLPSEERGGDEHAWDVLFDVQGQRIRYHRVEFLLFFCVWCVCSDAQRTP